ncbi:hypothetical protein E2C01_064871 [Portunus trituberculatus]|uniref:Uncharacterized protein n=1 Tax=Portunus trituberculatus TaxID=210409 RepID=A0A5B7HN36_PORTR|nr:hypothetical protein [Portunus trituberculatus]
MLMSYAPSRSASCSYVISHEEEEEEKVMVVMVVVLTRHTRRFSSLNDT